MFLITFHEIPLFRFHWFKNCFQRTLCSDFRSQLLFLFYENRPAKPQFQTLPFSANTRPEKIQTPPDRSATPYYVESFRFSAWVHGMNIQNIESIVLNLDLKPNLWIDCRQHEQCSSYFMKTNIFWKSFPGILRTALVGKKCGFYILLYIFMQVLLRLLPPLPPKPHPHPPNPSAPPLGAPTQTSPPALGLGGMGMGLGR